MKAAKDLYGDGIRVSLQEGDIERSAQPKSAEVDEVIDADAMMNEIAGDISNLFGVDVDIIDK